MEKDVIFVRKVGLIEAKVDFDLGVAKDSNNKYYIRSETPVPGSTRWVPEEEFWLSYKKSEKGGLGVSYGIKIDDPLRDRIHEVLYREDGVYQYQVSKKSGYIKLVKIANEKKFEPYAPESMKSIRNLNMRKGNKYNRRYKATRFHGEEVPMFIYSRRSVKV